MKRSSIVALLLAGCTLFCVARAEAQKFYKISLKELKIESKDIQFTVSEIIDARSDKNSLGVVQTGINNKSTFATFESPGLTELEDLIKNSGLHSPDGLSLRINVLKLSENTTLLKETGKAELSMDFFIRHEDLYYYITSVFTSEEPEGLDLTSKQAANIVTIVQNALVMFSQQKNEPDPDRSFTLEDLQDPELRLRDRSLMPILHAKKLEEGYFASFEEFINNKPSIAIGCKIKIGTPCTAKCGEVVKEVPSLYGFSHENKLYIFYHHEFYPLERRNDTFYFYGPSKLSKAPAATFATNYFGVLGVADRLVSGRGTYSALHMIDMDSGMVRNVTGF